MKKFFAVFCLLTLLATLFSCSGIPALASTKNTPKQAETKTKKVKSGRKKESVDVMKYVKKVFLTMKRIVRLLRLIVHFTTEK